MGTISMLIGTAAIVSPLFDAVQVGAGGVSQPASRAGSVLVIASASSASRSHVAVGLVDKTEKPMDMRLSEWWRERVTAMASSGNIATPPGIAFCESPRLAAHAEAMGRTMERLRLPPGVAFVAVAGLGTAEPEGPGGPGGPEWRITSRAVKDRPLRVEIYNEMGERMNGARVLISPSADDQGGADEGHAAQPKPVIAQDGATVTLPDSPIGDRGPIGYTGGYRIEYPSSAQDARPLGDYVWVIFKDAAPE